MKLEKDLLYKYCFWNIDNLICGYFSFRNGAFNGYCVNNIDKGYYGWFHDKSFNI